jgi:hypothetical protein
MAGGTKQRILEAIEKLPPATLEDAIERLVLLAKTERARAELDAGQGIAHADAKKRLCEWSWNESSLPSSGSW